MDSMEPAAMRINLRRSFRKSLVIGFLVICCLLPQQASAVAIYDWIPAPVPGHGGTGSISLDPLGAGATDSDFTSSTVLDFTFTFDNGAPTITLSDIIIVDPLETPMAVAGVLVSPWAFFHDPTTFTDARLVFAAGSADYKQFLTPNPPPLPFPEEVNSGSWVLRGPVPLDFKPQSCPNPLNVKSKGVFPVAILGTVDFDVLNVDPASVRLEGVAPLRSALEDVATPFSGVIDDALDCTDEGPDGFDDLTLKFRTKDIVAALGAVSDGDVRVLQLTGNLLDGTPIAGEDVVIIRKKGKN